MAKWNTLEAAVKELGEMKTLSWLNQMADNKAYRKVYNATKQEVNKIVRSDPAFKQLLNKAQAAAKRTGTK
jgi:hypothetical protein